jgi:[ribosomal protein S18]-alanine N-acetyltransferase
MLDLERQSPAAAHWSRQQYEALFVTARSQPQSEHFAWVVEDEGEAQSERVAGETPAILAFLAAHRIDVEWELENIVVSETARRQGLGTLLLREFVDHARAQHGIGIFLEVRQSNQNARSLYRKLGFQEAGLRKSYYVDPPEDAIICRLRLY